MKELRTMKEDDDELLQEGEKFGDWEIERFEKGLKKTVEKLERYGEGERVREKGNELATLMRDTARWHCEQYAEGVKEYDRLDKSAALAKGEKHFEATKELFGIVLDGRDEIKMTLCDAYRVMDQYPYEDTLLEKFERLTKELHEIRDTRYLAFDSDRMNGLLRACSFEGATAKWCKNMTFWE